MGRTRACPGGHSRWVTAGESGQHLGRKYRRAESHRAGVGGVRQGPRGRRRGGLDHRWAGSSGDEVRAARWTSGRPLLCAGLVWGRGEVT